MKRRKIGNIIISIMLAGILVLQTVVSANAAELIIEDDISKDSIMMDVDELTKADDELLLDKDMDLLNKDGLQYDDISAKDYVSDIVLDTDLYDGPIDKINEIAVDETEIKKYQANTGNVLTWPVPGRTRQNITRGITSGHNGMDIAASEGTHIVAAMEGTVKAIYTCSHNTYPNSLSCCKGNGTGLCIKGIDGRYYEYAHMQYGSIPEGIGINSYINKGQNIGKVGNTGNSKGAHLHFQIALGGEWGTYIDPVSQTYDIDGSIPILGKDMGEESPFDPEIEDDDYVIMSALRYDLHLNIEGDDTSDDDDNVNVERGFYEDSKYDVFKVRLLDNGYYKLIQNKTNHMAVSVAGRSSSEDANIQMYYWNPEDLSNTEFQWAIEWAKKQDGVPYHYIRPRCSGLYMTAAGSSNGRNVYQASKDEEDDDCQKWFFARYMKPDIETNSLPKGEVGKGYIAKLEADSDFDVKWTFNSKNDNLPPGLSLDKAGKITGTPTQPGTYTFSLDAENLLVDALGYSTKQYTIVVSGDITINKIALNKETLELTKGNSETLIATVEPANATNRKITWSSDNDAVATVDENGKITAVSEGTAKITASSNDGSDKSATCVVTVKPIPIPDGITIKADEVTGVAGKPISVPVRILGNTGLGSMALTITSDPALTLTGIERGDILKKGTFETDVKTGLVQWWTTSNSNAEGDGILFILKYDIKSDANIGKYPISVSCTGGIKENITDKESVTLDVTIIDGSLIIANIVIIPGDVTGNGMVAMDDVVKVARAASGNVKLTDAEKLAGDVTGDGVVAMGDVVKIARFVAKSIDKL